MGWLSAAFLIDVNKMLNRGLEQKQICFTRKFATWE